MLCMKAPSRRSKVRETVKLPEEGHYERRQASRVWEQGKKAKPKATLDRTGSEQPSRIEDLEYERVRKLIYHFPTHKEYFKSVFVINILITGCLRVKNKQRR
ncbi:Hypothetical_protein [Hexamita inflata]|uniref:Hypothetical_protein n=1 Tax=Hexamita inflata TaxID=28002 RepID=A0AA86RUT6_9EUKA|nr:Hypothetical protein HINF_LOCUS60625 [Hexamita inflata]